MINSNKLEKLKQQYDNIELPDEVDQIIYQAIEKGRSTKKKRFIGSSVVVACILTFILSINIFPSFAENFVNIPGISEVVKLLSFSKGFKLAAQNGCVQNIGKSAQDKGIKITVDKVIYDGKKLIIAYELESKESLDLLQVSDLEIELKGESSISNWSVNTNFDFYNFMTNEREIRKKDYIKFNGQTWTTTGTINIELDINNTNNPKDYPKDISIICHRFNYFNRKGSIEGSWKIEFEVNIDKLPDFFKIYNVNRNLSIEDKHLFVSAIKSYPTTMLVPLNVTTNSDNKVIGFKNPRLEDDKGNLYTLDSTMSISEIANRKDYVSRGINGINILTFESAYFDSYKHLYLKSDGIYYMPKGDNYITINLEKGLIEDNLGYKIEYLGYKKDVNSSEYGKSDLSISCNIMETEKDNNDFPLEFELMAYKDTNQELFDDNKQIPGRISSQIYKDNKFVGFKTTWYFNKLKQIPQKIKFKIQYDKRKITKPFSIKLR